MVVHIEPPITIINAMIGGTDAVFVETSVEESDTKLSFTLIRCQNHCCVLSYLRHQNKE